ncbi:hypothetical protein T12_2440 [Trichinella patagoniensis]|uniref:Uncharacterized protein n=1 Tax=Trichinella patagoniensis TaxID=990121 RepID=A0A0V0Z3I9_9BILA|nr:hypothetical protein T12_2440 [Trichinella patagoniensis]
MSRNKSVQVSSAGVDDSKNDAEDKECIQVSSASTDSKNDAEDKEYIQVSSASTDSKNDAEDKECTGKGICSMENECKYGKQPEGTPGAKFLKNRKFLKNCLRHSPRRSLRA